MCVCVCVCDRENEKERERENERVQPEIAIHTNKLPRKKRPACPPPSLRHCCPPFVHPFVCVHWMHLVRFICFYYHFCPSLHSFFSYFVGPSARWQPWQQNALVNKFSTLSSVWDATLKCLELAAMQRYMQ